MSRRELPYSWCSRSKSHTGGSGARKLLLLKKHARPELITATLTLLLSLLVGCASPPPSSTSFSTEAAPTAPDSTSLPVPTEETPAPVTSTSNLSPLANECTPTPAMHAPLFKVIYTCGQSRQLCLAGTSGEVQYLTDALSSGRITDLAVDPRHRWIVYARQLGATFSEELRCISLRSGEELSLLSFDAPYAVRGFAWSPTGGLYRLCDHTSRNRAFRRAGGRGEG